MEEKTIVTNVENFNFSGVDKPNSVPVARIYRTNSGDVILGAMENSEKIRENYELLQQSLQNPEEPPYIKTRTIFAEEIGVLTSEHLNDYGMICCPNREINDLYKLQEIARIIHNRN